MTVLQTSHFEVSWVKGSLRWIRVGTTEIVRMVYAAVRDPDWGTIEPSILNERVEAGQNSFRIDFDCHWYQSPIAFKAHLTITGSRNTLQVTMEGEALSAFRTNRTGFCVLYPVNECQGKPCKVTHPDGTAELSEFPFLVAPHQPMLYISSLEWDPAPDIKARISFKGDVFEMEDQRNWTDASFKTYCRPLSRPFPYEIKKGDRISQSIYLEIESTTTVQSSEIKSAEPVRFEIDTRKTQKFPRIGLGLSSRVEPLRPEEAAYLKNLKIDHLRAEIRFTECHWQEVWRRALFESELISIPLFLVLYLSENYQSELKLIMNTGSGGRIMVRYVLVVGQDHLPGNALFDAAFPELREMFPRAKIGTGVNAYFAELNRNRPVTRMAEFVSFAVSPQVHANDNISLVENLEGQKYAVETARYLFPDKPVFVSPVTLKQRFNVVATSAEATLQPDALPPQVDIRQRTAFTAGWTAISLKYLAQSGAAVVTFFETTGWRGIMQGSYGPPIPAKFPAEAGERFPVYQVLKEICHAYKTIWSSSSAPLKVDGLVVADERLKILLVNFSDSPQQVNFNRNITGWRIKNLNQTETQPIPDSILTILPEQILIVYPSSSAGILF